MQPQAIEQRSFDIIDAEAGNHGFPPDQWMVVRRMIHTSADFDYLKTVRIHPSAIQKGVAAIRRGDPLFTDTQMAKAGIRKLSLEPFGTTVTCLIDDPDVRSKAAQSGTTRSHAAVDTAVAQTTGGIFVVGNAPTALLRLIELVRGKKAAPSLIIGLPVGFVNAAESKAALIQLGLPHITNTGRKGGSNVAAAVVNALIILAEGIK